MPADTLSLPSLHAVSQQIIRYVEAGKRTQAIALLCELARHEPPDTRILAQAGRLALQLGFYALAEEALLRGLEHMPGERQLLSLLAQCGKLNGRLDRSGWCYARLKEQFPQEAAFNWQYQAVQAYLASLASLDSRTQTVALRGVEAGPWCATVPETTRLWLKAYKYNLLEPARRAARHGGLPDADEDLHLFLYYLCLWMLQDVLMLAPYLPADNAHILDIGGGIGLFDWCLSRFRPHAGWRYTLIELERIDEVTHHDAQIQRHRLSTPLAVLDTARAFLEANGFAREAVRFLNAERAGRELAAGPRVDWVISIRSWGFLYPLETYLEPVRAVLNPGGSVILDVKKNGPDEAELRRHFALVHPIRSYEQATRLLCRHPC